MSRRRMSGFAGSTSGSDSDEHAFGSVGAPGDVSLCYLAESTQGDNITRPLNNIKH